MHTQRARDQTWAARTVSVDIGMVRTQEMLACTLTFRESARRSTPLPSTLGEEDAIDEWRRVLLHEARESFDQPLEGPPLQAFLHAVDVDTEEPGIVDRDENQCEVVRRIPHAAVRRVSYNARNTPAAPFVAPSNEPVAAVTAAEAHEAAKKAVELAIRHEQRKAAASERAVARAAERKEVRAKETAGQRTERLDQARAKREDRKRSAAATADSPAAETTAKRTKGSRALPPAAILDVEDEVDACTMPRNPPTRRRRKGDPDRFFECPLPHDRHLRALQRCAPHARLMPALLRGEPCDDLCIVQGPPGTGKTRYLVERLVPRDPGRRCLLVAPTNVGACNLYERCISSGLGDECALAVAAERVPPGVAVLSRDPGRRIVCATISARAGAQLDTQVFDTVLVDEAAQCMEAWVWTLLRADVRFLGLAGDVRQLPAIASESGRALRHERSLMERLLVDLGGYANTVSLTVQNRMAPELLAFPNEAFYEGALTTGPHAPTEPGVVEILQVDDARDESKGTSWHNRLEAKAAAARAAELAAGDGSVVILTPYAAQRQVLLAQKTGIEVHTVDSFQGREADCVVLSVVRSGALGFWEDDRRATVALTRARRRLVVVASATRAWPEDSVLARLLRRSAAARP